MCAVPLAAPAAHANADPAQTFSFTGAPATWNVPSEVDSVYVEAISAPGGADGRGFSVGGQNAYVMGVLFIPESTQQLTVNVGGAGQDGSGKDSGGQGGWNGGADGGSGSGQADQGGGGGGATDIRMGGTALADRVIVAGGGGGGGGYMRSGQVSSPGNGGNAWPPPTNGMSATGSNGGSGGAGSSITGGNGTSGGDAGDLTGDGGGGGGGGGYEGGAGGGAGQGDWGQTAASGGGGGAGSSYADPASVTSAQTEEAPAQTAASATISWVALESTPLPDFAVGTQISPVQMQGQVPSGHVDWAVSSGALPAGISLSESGQLTGTPTQGGLYEVTITGSWSEDSLVSSSVSYSGAVSDPAIPGAPTALTATGAPTDLVAQLDWTAPNSDGGHPIQEYWYRYSSNNGKSWSKPITTASTATSTTVAVPAEGNYLFQVAAANQYQQGPWSAHSPATAVPSAPSAPSTIKAVSGFESVALNWPAPSWTGVTAVTDYDVRFSDDGGNSWNAPISTGSSASKYVYTGLTNGVPLVFSVRAVNAYETGPWSPASNAVTPETLPTAPTGLTGEPGNRTVALQWTAPQSFGGESLIGYRIQIKTPDQGWAVRIPNTNSSATQASVTDLINGVDYDFRVAAVTTGGVGPYSQPSTVEVPFTQPSRVPEITAQASNAGANLTWRQPERDNGSPVTGYRIEVESGSGWLVLVPDTGTTALEYTAAGLENGKVYRFRVAAINAAGPGKPSPSAVVSPQGPATGPSAPQFVQVLPGKARAQVTWRPPGSAGTFPVTGYAVQMSAPGGPWTAVGTTASLNHTVRGLNQKTKYRFRVAATSAAGNGAWSKPVAVTTSRAPSAPILRRVTLDGKKARVRLVAGSLGYQQFQRRGSNGRWRTLVRGTVTLGANVTQVRVRAVRGDRHSDPTSVRVDRQWRKKPLNLSVTIDRDLSHIDGVSGGSAKWRYRRSAPWTPVSGGDITLRTPRPGWHLQVQQTKGKRQTTAEVVVR